MHPVIQTSLIAAIEVSFSLLKSVLLATQSLALRIAAVLSFLLESGAGLFLTIFGTVNVFQSEVGVLLAIRLGTIAIILTEIASIVTEGFSVHRKITARPRVPDDSPDDLPEPVPTFVKTRKRRILKWAALLLGLAIVGFAFAAEVSRRVEHKALVMGVLAVVVAQAIVLALISGCLRLWLKTRLVAALGILLGDIALAAGLLAWGGLATDTNVKPYDFFVHVAAAIFVLAVACALIVTSHFGLAGYREAGGLTPEQAQFVETACFALAPATVVVGLTQRRADSAAQLLLTILPQMSALLLPLLSEFIQAILPCFG